MKLNHLNLAFSGEWKHLEPDFLREYAAQSVTYLRVAFWIGILFYAVFGILDVVLIPEKKEALWFIRFAIVCPVIFLSFLLTFWSGFQKWMQVIVAIVIILAGGGILYGVAVGYHALTKKEGMGGGDIKLLAMVGALLGWKGALTSLMVGAFLGSIIGVALMILKGKDTKYAIPFGPFLALGAFCSLLWGDTIIHYYLTLGR